MSLHTLEILWTLVVIIFYAYIAYTVGYNTYLWAVHEFISEDLYNNKPKKGDD